MVPYVRKSFMKHFKDGCKYVARVDEDTEFFLSQHDALCFDTPALKENYPRTYNYAMDMTIKEIYQAVEGMYHNLKIWAH